MQSRNERDQRNDPATKTCCFISHKQSDGDDLARTVAKELDYTREKYFVDFDVVKTSAIKRDIIHQKIRDAEFFVFIITDGYMRSLQTPEVDYCKTELEWALKYRTTEQIVPVVHNSCTSKFLNADFITSLPPHMQRAFAPLAVQHEGGVRQAQFLRELKNRIGIVC
ncbi:hypothetical protein CYMTET_10690 [Cymbomonas tetramitiformis]|uniref:TIR domain-containing protein n=1 Tax=Cymbomonas tetramitiformis TaxID=36881 RepID=A0AAE0LDR6_9CHLO|nr:hypothetical protein CYMTET_10690 [Cymbomonas tetramitiformis]